MTDTMSANAPVSPAPVDPDSPTQAQQICLVASFIVSGIALLFAGFIYLLVHHHNMVVASGQGSGHVATMMGHWDPYSDLPLYMFTMFVVGVAALILALIGAPAARQAWVNVVAGALAVSILMVPLVVIANKLLTVGIFPNIGGGD